MEKSKLSSVCVCTQYDAGINIQMEFPGERFSRSVRYVQVGIQTDGKFTGIITDYAGGGEFQEFYFLDGKEILDDEDRVIEDSFKEELINTAYPGLIYKIYEIRDLYFFYDENCSPVATDFLISQLQNLPSGYLFQTGALLVPVTCSCGLTIFPDSAGMYSTTAELEWRC